MSLSIKEVNYSYIVYTTIPVFFACFKLNTCTVNKVLYAFEAINFKDHFDRKWQLMVQGMKLKLG